MTDEESSKLTPAYTNPLKTFIDDKIAPIIMKVLQGQITAPDFVENNPQGTTIQTYDDTGRPMTLVQKTDGTIVFSTEEYNKYLVQKKFDQELSDNTLTKVLMDTPGKVAGETGNVKTMGGMAEGSSKAGNLAEVSPLLKTESNTAFFWSGKTNGVGGAEKAAEIAKSQGGTTLESMIAEKKINMPEWDINNPSSIKAWEDVSAEYAKQVAGEVKAVVGKDLGQGNIWENVELPRLKDNPKVTKITTVDPETGLETVIFERK